MLLNTVLFFLMLVLVYLVTKLLLTYRKIWILLAVSALFSSLLTFLLIFILNEPSYFYKQQVELLKYWGHTNEKEVSRGYKFIKDHFIIVDNSYDKQLIERPDIGSDSHNTAITDRNKLVRFFRFLNQNINSIDLVICDIAFVDPSPLDSLLKNEMDRIYLKKKLLVAYDEQNSSANIFKFDPTICGDIREAANDTKFISHTIQKAEDQSLAYKIYTFQNKIKQTELFGGNIFIRETDSNYKRHYVLNSFIPKFSLSNEALLIGEDPKDNKTPYSNSGIVQPGFNWLTLGEAAANDGQENLLINLNQRHDNGQKNYIFLGAFKNPDEDVHNTIYKPMHGVAILLNTFYDLNNGNNRIGVIQLFMIFLGFLIITVMLFSLSLKYPAAHFIEFIKRKLGSKPARLIHKKRASRFGFILFPFKFLITKELHYLLLFGQFILIAYKTGLIFNVMYFAFYFFIIEGSMKYFSNSIETKAQKKAL